MKGIDFMLNNFHGIVFGYKVNSTVFYEICGECDDNEYNILRDHTWQIDKDTFIINYEILVNNQDDDNTSFGLIEINQLLVEKKDEIDNFIKYVQRLFGIFDSPITILPQLYYINVTE